MKSKTLSGKFAAGSAIRMGVLLVLLGTLLAGCAPPPTVASATPTQSIPATATAVPVVDTATSVPSPTVSRATGEAILQQTVAAMPTRTPAPTPQITFPATVPDFTLKGANGVVLNLYDQLAKGPVVLQFFRMAG